MDIKNLRRRLKRLITQRDYLLKDHEGNEQNFTYWGGHKLGYVKGKIYEIENILDEYNNNWISIEEDTPKRGFEVLLYNKNWIHEDFNPQGIRIGFLDDLNGWTSAYWCNYHDEYHTRTSDENDNQFEDFKAENQIPTHWKPLF